MKPFTTIVCVAWLAFLTTNTPAWPQGKQKAFPTAEGFGQYSKGGRGGKVIYVTSLADSGPGTLRAAIDTDGPRTVIFRVGGIIALKKELKITKPYLTIAGQTAPGDGICLKGQRFKIDAHDVICRYLRSRLGDEARVPEDSIATYTNGHDVILDHCSASWSVDETLSTTHAKEVTVQWCIISESLNRSVHPKGPHGYGSLINGGNISFHHNLYAYHTTRVPRPAACLLDFRNNILYHFGSGYNHGEDTRMNYVGNWIDPGGKGGSKPVAFKVGGPKTRIWFEGNNHATTPAATQDNGMLFSLKNATLNDIKAAKPFPIAPTTTHTAQKAYELVLDGAGAMLPRRDPVDARIVDQVRKRTGKIINSQKDVGGYPEYKSGQPYPDTDGDGIPDDWEKKHGLDPKNPADANQVPDADGYTYLEHFLNGTEPKKTTK